MGLFSKAIAIETKETPTPGTHPGLLNRAGSARPEEGEAPEAPGPAPVKKKVRKVTRRRSRRSPRNR